VSKIPTFHDDINNDSITNFTMVCAAPQFPCDMLDILPIGGYQTDVVNELLSPQ